MRVVILGSGVVGVTSAWYLSQAGHEVTVIDRESGPALETSAANAGQISPGYAAPWAAPGVPLKAIKWMFQRHAPLAISLDGTQFQLKWMWQMLRNCDTRHYMENKGRMVRLAEYSRDCLKALRDTTGIQYEGRQGGTLQLFRTAKQYENATRDIAVLEDAGRGLGIVTAISGMRLHRIVYKGRSDHAASPMQGRRDPAAGFAELAFRMERLWKEGGLPEDFSCTIGELACSPNVGIVVPESVTFTIDIRHVDVPVLEEGWKRIESLVRSVAESRGLDLELVRLSASGGVRTSSEVGEVFRQAAERRGVQPLLLKSGPAHDAASLGGRVPVGLLFVPSIKGLSHCPQEATAPEHLALGAWVLEDALRSLAGGGRP